MAGDLGTTGDYYGISDTWPGGRKIKKKGKKKGSEGCLGDKTYKFGTVPKERKGDGGEKKFGEGDSEPSARKTPLETDARAPVGWKLDPKT